MIKMRNVLIIAVFLLSGKSVWAIGYSGLNDELLAIYALVVGFCIVTIALPKAIKYIRNRFPEKSSEMDAPNTK